LGRKECFSSSLLPIQPLVHPRLTTPSPILVLLSSQNKTIAETILSTYNLSFICVLIEV